MLLRFTYTNWRGVDHEYVIEPLSIEFGPYDQGGVNDGREQHWVMHGDVVTRDDDPRPEMGPTRRRTFIITGMRHVEEVPRSA